VDPTASFAFVTGSNNVKVESIGQTGALTFVEQKRLSHATDAAVDPTGTFLYVTSDDTNTVAGYRISSTGNLTHIPNSPFATGGQPFAVVVDNTGKFVYVTNFGANSISGYRIGSNGALSPLSSSPFPTGSKPYRLGVVP
jgi:6-phosphogluconolactonase (cycloisomerase 2 family)